MICAMNCTSKGVISQSITCEWNAKMKNKALNRTPSAPVSFSVASLSSQLKPMAMPGFIPFPSNQSNKGICAESYGLKIEIRQKP
jgi:hypothetical protein